MKIDQLQTPCYVIDEKKMRENLEILKKSRRIPGERSFWRRKRFPALLCIP